MKPLSVGFIGSGFMAQFHARALLNVRLMSLDGLLARSNARAFADWIRRESLGAGNIFSSIGEMAENVDCIAIYSPNDSKVAVMEEIAAARRRGARVSSVIADKPLGRNVAEALQIVELARSAKLLTAYFENQIFMKAIMCQLEQLGPVMEKMGPMALSRSSEEHGGPHMPWFWDPIKQGGGVLSDMGCHSIAVGWYVLTPPGEAADFLIPESVSCEVALLKWGTTEWREKLLQRTGVDYAKTPAEDFATGMVTFRNPKSGQRVKAQFTDSWMFEKQGLRLFMDGMGPGYAFEINTLQSPLHIFISDAAAKAVQDGEKALEKATASRGLLAVQTNEVDLYGYIDENRDAAESFLAGRDGKLSFEYGLAVMKLVMASYLAAEERRTVDLTDAAMERKLATYRPLIQQGRGREVLF